MTTLSPDNDKALLIVGIGASAGGLAAFSELLRQLPANPGMAFVLVQHLDPEQESMLGELLDNTTPMIVSTAKDGMEVEADHVYVIPPGTQMTIAQGVLHLSSRDRTPGAKTIDLFFQSLAEDQKNRAIAIVLSGSNNDGAIGIQEIRAAGGITFAQDRSTAEFAELPNAAVATGQVDFVLPPAQMAEELIKISQQTYLCEPLPLQDQPDTPLSQDDELRTVYQLLQRQMGVDFTQYKQTTFVRRLRRRMALQKLAQLTDYVQYLRETPSEIQTLYHDVLITVTSFFRDIETFSVLQERVFSELLEQDWAASSIRIWVAGCGTGEEVYSIAICLLEKLDSMMINPTIQIFGTDVNERTVEIARSGSYQDAQMEGVSPERRRRFFTEINGSYYINKSVREICIFAQHDLSSDPPFSDIDIVSCRNVLIYFNPPLQQRVLSIFHYSLKPTGFLVLGNSESVGDTSDLFEVYDSPTKIFLRKAVPTPLSFDFLASHYPHQLRDNDLQSFATTPNRSNVQQWADQIVINRYAPVGVVVDENLRILQFRGDTSDYLKPPLGEPSFNLLKMLHPALLVDVRTTIEQAKQQKIAVRWHSLRIEEMQEQSISVEIIPFSVAQGYCYLILFDRSLDRPSVDSPDEDEQTANPKEVAPETEVARLQRELALARQELLDTQTFLNLTVEEQESIRQKLTAANEEILSSNEELKSTNEELQTAKEEIQSANEELRTTNEELQSRNVESRRANDDLINLLNNVNIPILMLSNDLNIRSFTPAARGIFNLIPTDVGRPINNIRHNVDLPDLEHLAQEVMETLSAVEREVQSHQGHWYLLRIRPYRTLENQINGAVLALVDIDNLRRTEQELRDSQSQLQRELTAMNQIQALSLQLFSSLDLNQALNEVLEAAIAILQTPMGFVLLYDAEQDQYKIAAQQGFEPQTLEQFEELWTHNRSTYGRSLKQGERVIIEDVQTLPELEPFRQVAEAAGFRALQATPLVNRNREILGIISTHFQHPYQPTQRELQLLDLYVREASGFVEWVHVEQERQRLDEQERAARAANAVKDEFLAVLSHELRTPLNSVLGWAQILEQKTLRESTLKTLRESTLNRAIASIKNGALAQLQLIEDLLDTSCIIQERFQISLEPTDLTGLLEEAIASIHPQMAKKDIQIEADLEPLSELYLFDPGRMKQVFVNLLFNAVKFTPSGGRVRVQLTPSPIQIQVQVSDTGRGIEPDILPYIFDRFQQADSSNIRQEGGLGLGLFLVKSIVEAHDGTVAVDSPGIDQGATFTVTLPKVRVESEPPLPATAATPDKEISLEGIRLLITDDNSENIFLFTTIFQGYGATVVSAQSAAAALDLIPEQDLDLLIFDIGLPGMNGYELMRQVRSLPADQGGELPAIALTGYVSEQDIQAAMEAGFQCHIAKPVDVDQLVNTVCRLVSESL